MKHAFPGAGGSLEGILGRHLWALHWQGEGGEPAAGQGLHCR